MITLTRILTVAMVAIVPVAAYIFYEQRDRELSAPPSEKASTNDFDIKPSTISVKIRLTFNQLSAQANRSAPQSYSESERHGPPVCIGGGLLSVCADTKYSYNVSRGDISISQGPNNTIRVSVPISVAGSGGFRGDGARLVGLDAKNFRARIEAYSDIALSIGQDWCPRPTVSSTFNWIDPAEVEIVGGVWVPINGLVENGLRDGLQQMGNAVASQIKCSDVKREAEKAWASYSFPIEIPGNEDSLYINVKPESFGFSGLQVSPGFANLALSLTAKADVSTSSIEATKLGLPPLQSIPLADSSLKVAVPIHLPYAEIQQLLSSQIVNKPISIDTKVGVATVTTRKLKVYPSEDALAIGALLDIDLPDRWLDVSGWVYLKTKPTPLSGETGLKLEDPSFSRALNNELWNVVSVVLHGTIMQEIERNGVINLEEPIKQAKEIVASAVSKPHEGVNLNIGNPDIRLGRIGVTADRLFVECLFASKADISLTAF